MSDQAVSRFILDARRALSILVGAGAASADTSAVKTWSDLGGRAKALGLPDLADRCRRVAGQLEGRGALAFEASMPLADATLAVHDRVEALASAAMLWDVEEWAEEAYETSGSSERVTT